MRNMIGKRTLEIISTVTALFFDNGSSQNFLTAVVGSAATSAVTATAMTFLDSEEKQGSNLPALSPSPPTPYPPPAPPDSSSGERFLWRGPVFGGCWSSAQPFFVASFASWKRSVIRSYMELNELIEFGSGNLHPLKWERSQLWAAFVQFYNERNM